MAEHLIADRAHVFRDHVAAALDEGVGFGRERKGDAGTRGGAVGDKALKLLQAIFFRRTAGIDDIHDVTLYLFVHIYVANHFPRPDDVFRFHHGLGLGEFPGIVHPDNLLFLLFLGVRDHHLEHETVYLGFRQRISAFLLDRVLGGHHQERLRQFVCILADSHLLLLHGFQQGALHLCRGTVDFIGQYEVGEDGAFVHLEFFPLLGIDQGAHHVCGQQVRGELDTAEFGIHRLGQRIDGQGFGQSRNTFQQDVPAGEQADEQVVYQMLLPHNHFAHFQGQQVHEGTFFLDSLV